VALQRVSLTDVEHRERLFFQFAPETLTLRLRPKWKERLPVNGSRGTSFYEGTESVRVPLELFYTVVGAAGEGAEYAFPDLQQIEAIPVANPADFEAFGADDVRPSLEGPARFLASLCYNDPEIARSGLSGNFTPPTVIFDWPGILSLEGHVENLDLGYRQFDHRDMRGLVLVANFDFVEDFEYDNMRDDDRIRNRGVRIMGQNRANRKLLPRPQADRSTPAPVTVTFSRTLTD
jgi:hypothetical protein